VTEASHIPPHDPHAVAAPHVVAAQHGSHKRTYIQIFIWLTVLTAIEVGVVFAPLNRFVLITILVALAVVKAALVAMFFMHLRFERKTLALVVMTPIVLAGILIIGLMPDSQSWFITR
jgi:cytochrome c oxidase subunit IV